MECKHERINDVRTSRNPPFIILTVIHSVCSLMSLVMVSFPSSSLMYH